MFRVVGVVLLFVLAPVTTPAANGPGAVVFVYHRFGEDRHPSTSVRLEQFEAQLEHLAAGGYSVLPLERIVRAVIEGEALPDRAVAITIDDAYRSIHDEAYPRLKERGWPFTVFVTTNPVDAGLVGYLDWDQMREMGRHGAAYANHTSTHDSLIERRPGESEQAWRERVREEIEHAGARLRDELGSTSKLFAYPYGEYDEAVAGIVQELGYVAFGQQSGALGTGSDRRALPRFPVAGIYAALDGFKTKAATLPFPVEEYRPWNPLTRERRPRLEVVLGAGDARTGELACYVGGQGRVEVTWTEPGKRFTVRAEEDLPDGRNRYNCTAPAAEGGRYHWLSQQWIVKP